MKEILILLLAGAVAYLGYDNSQQRAQVAQFSEQISRLTIERDTAALQEKTRMQERNEARALAQDYAARLNSPKPGPQVPQPNWLQQKVNERSGILDKPARGRSSAAPTLPEGAAPPAN